MPSLRKGLNVFHRAFPYLFRPILSPLERFVNLLAVQWLEHASLEMNEFFFVLIPIAPSLVALLAVALALFLPWGVRFFFFLWFVAVVGLQLFMDCASAIAFQAFPICNLSLFATFVLQSFCHLPFAVYSRPSPC